MVANILGAVGGGSESSWKWRKDGSRRSNITLISSPPRFHSYLTLFQTERKFVLLHPSYPFSFLILNYVIYSAYFMRKPAIWDFYEHLISYPAGTWTTGNARSPDREYPRAKGKNPLFLFLFPFLFYLLFIFRSSFSVFAAEFPSTLDKIMGRKSLWWRCLNYAPNGLTLLLETTLLS